MGDTEEIGKIRLVSKASKEPETRKNPLSMEGSLPKQQGIFLVMPPEFGDFPVIFQLEQGHQLDQVTLTLPVDLNIELPGQRKQYQAEIDLHGENLLKPGNWLQTISEIKALYELKEACFLALGRKLTGYQFREHLERLNLPGELRGEVFQAFFQVAAPPKSNPDERDLRPESKKSNLGDDLDQLLSNIDIPESSNGSTKENTKGSTKNISTDPLIDAIAGESSGYLLTPLSAESFTRSLEKSLQSLEKSWFHLNRIESAGGVGLSLTRAMRIARKSSASALNLCSYHSWKELGQSGVALAHSQNARAIILSHEIKSSEEVSRWTEVAKQWECPIVAQVNSESPEEMVKLWKSVSEQIDVYLVGGEIAIRLPGDNSDPAEQINLFQPASMALASHLLKLGKKFKGLEGMEIILENQDIQEVGNLWIATKKLITQVDWSQLHLLGVHYANGIKNRDVVNFLPFQKL